MNWVVRRPTSRSHTPDAFRARYPPQNMLNANYKRPPRASQDWEATATYSESPFPIAPETSAYSALCELQSSHADISKPVNILDVLMLVYKHMGDRCSFTDPWLENFATRPDDESIDQYKNELAIFKEREKDHPSAPVTVRNAFNKDRAVLEEVERRLQDALSGSDAANNGASRSSVNKCRAQILKQLFEEASLRPGGLDKCTALVEKDHERYAEQLKHFKEVAQNKFDEEHGLLPVSCRDPLESVDGVLVEVVNDE